jgi:hypothetical protein
LARVAIFFEFVVCAGMLNIIEFLNQLACEHVLYYKLYKLVNERAGDERASGRASESRRCACWLKGVEA